jgi:hypothetical protein
MEASKPSFSLEKYGRGAIASLEIASRLDERYKSALRIEVNFMLASGKGKNILSPSRSVWAAVGGALVEQLKCSRGPGRDKAGAEITIL